ncbi:MAG TPA: two-component system sensor histidine kinase CreC, partial [Lamprocystis sp. (in: g-proteobacteria)]|nr:two-component system sensor histidine kinase CreC [Lamprocystis sp. (in: g-proteobacteria)]
MRLSLQVALGYFLIVGLAGWFVLTIFVAEVKPGVREATEDTLVDTANLIAELIAPALAAAPGPAGDTAGASQAHPGDPIAAALAAYNSRGVTARIWNIDKRSLDQRVTVTDAAGRVVYATDPTLVGQDFSQWNDVYRTLRGGYGARSTRNVPGDDKSTVMYVAAPVVWDGRTLGVVSVGKPSATLAHFIARSEAKIRDRGLLLLLVSGLIGALFTWHLTRAIARLRRYALDVAEGRRSPPPRSSARELSDLAEALTAMRERLEGRHYVERYVHTLTHELKSPLAAIRGAAELLAEDDMPAAERWRFLTNIRDQEERLRKVAERMLNLALVEQQTALEESVPVDLMRLSGNAVEAVSATARARGVALVVSGSGVGTNSLIVAGDPFLLHQALVNLLENAIAFSPAGGQIDIRLASTPGGATISVHDQGPGVPDYALGRVF